MKKCNQCGEEFGYQFRFCPIDGTTLSRLASSNPTIFQLTLIEDAHLGRRLAMEAAFVCHRISAAWPSFREHPAGFTKSQIVGFIKYLKQQAGRTYAIPALTTAFVSVVVVILAVAILDARGPQISEPGENDDFAQVVTIDLGNLPNEKSDSGVGAGEEGRVGFARGKGQGSNPLPARAQGGGGGGAHNPLPPSKGRPPIASPIPAPIPTTYARLPQSLPAAGLDIDPALYRQINLAAYGDPRSKSNTPSNGPGDGGGVGTNQGQGIGEGDGPGFGSGRKGNMGGGDNKPGSGGGGGGPGCATPGCVGSQIYKAAQVTQRARVLFKPEPQYTEQARRNGVTGTVILRVVFSSSGEVTNIQAVQKLGDGLTERAIAAARQIRFVPALRNGQPVAMYMQLEYNFNLY
jgi:TonB family protein